MLTLNAPVQTQMTLNSQIAQIRQLSPENTKRKTHKIISANHKLKLPEIEEELKISEGSVFTIFLEHLWMRKLCSKLELRLFTFKQKQKCFVDSERCLQPFLSNKKKFLRKYVTKDETWITHFSPEPNRQSAEWAAAGQSHPKRPKTQTSEGRVLTSIFWDVQGILFIDYLKKGRTINTEYCMILLVRLKGEIAKNCNKWKRKKCSFTKEMHRSQLYEFQFEWLPQPRILQIWPPATTGCLQTSKVCSMTRDLAPRKKWYRKLRRILRPKTNRTTTKGIELLEKRWIHCINLGDYVDK